MKKISNCHKAPPACIKAILDFHEKKAHDTLLTARNPQKYLNEYANHLGVLASAIVKVLEKNGV